MSKQKVSSVEWRFRLQLLNTEVILILTSRDSLILAHVMFVSSIDAIKAWQMGY